LKSFPVQSFGLGASQVRKKKVLEDFEKLFDGMQLQEEHHNARTRQEIWWL
jgi:hypothetical protein